MVLILVLFCMVGWMVSSCSPAVQTTTTPMVMDGKYDSEFPAYSSGDQLKQVAKSIRMINCIAFYKRYLFLDPFPIREKLGGYTDLLETSSQIENYTRTTSGTATIIYHDGYNLALITCAHILDYPDTVLTYADDNETLVQAVAVKTRQINYLAYLLEGEEIEILAMDTELDLAVLGVQVSRPEDPISVFPFPFGNSRDLEWGSFVYMFGYPMGKKMVTRGIVSRPRQGSKEEFLIDAPFNKGSSGGVVLAIRDGVPNFELVGIAKSAAAKFEHVLAPPEGIAVTPTDLNKPYVREIFIREQRKILYGVTYVVGIGSIRKMLRSNQAQFLEKGYDFQSSGLLSQ